MVQIKTLGQTLPRNTARLLGIPYTSNIRSTLFLSPQYEMPKHGVSFY